MRNSIQTKLAVFVAVAVVVTGAIMGWLGFRFAQDGLSKEIHARLVTLVHDRAARLDTYVAQQNERAQLIASRTKLRDSLAQAARAEVAEDEFRRVTKGILRDAIRGSDDIRDVSITDANGVVVTSTDDATLGKNVSEHPSFQIGKNRSHVGKPERGADGFRAIVSTPAVANNGEFLGVVLLVLDLRGLQSILADETGIGESGELFAASVSNDTLELLLPRPGEQEGSSLTRNTAPAIFAAVEAASTDYAGTRISETKVLAAWRPIRYQSAEIRRWTLIAKIDESEAYASVTKLQRLQWLMQALLLLVGISAAMILAQKFSSPIRNLADAADKIAHHDMSARIHATSDDEIGQLSQSFNKMADELEKSYSTLEAKVDTRTRELASANERLEQSNVELQQFAYAASHDLKEPLRAVLSFSDLLKKKYAGQLDERADEYIHFMSDGARRMERLIDDLLRYSQVTTQGHKFERCCSREMVDEAVANLSQAILESKASIVIGELPDIWCDRGQITRIFQNLVANAIKFRKPGVQPVIEIGATNTGDVWRFSIRDNGIGVAPKFADSIFQIFNRLHSREEYPGTGIGLAVCKRIIQRHSGEIGIESNSEQGSTFWFAIPQLASHDEAPQADIAADP